MIDITGAVTDGQLHLTWSYNEKIHDREHNRSSGARLFEALHEIIDHCASEEAFGYTPSDFPLANLGQKDLDRYLSGDPSIEDVTYLVTPAAWDVIPFLVCSRGRRLCCSVEA